MRHTTDFVTLQMCSFVLMPKKISKLFCNIIESLYICIVVYAIIVVV